MIIFEPRNTVKVNTPKGRGRIWLVTDYGLETQKLFTCILDETGQIWEFTNDQVIVQNNPTLDGYEV